MTFNENEPKPEETPAEENGFADAFAARTVGEEIEDEASPTEEEGVKPADAEPASVAATEPVAAPSGSTFDPFAGMTPEQKTHWEKVQHSDQSQRGRVAALTRKMQNVAVQPAPATSAQAEVNADTTESNDLDAKMLAAADEYPDAVGPLVEIIQTMKKQMAEITNKVEPIADDHSEAELIKAYKALEVAHPDYREVAADPAWQAWIENQPEAIQTLAESYDPDHVAKTIDLFKLERSQAAGSPAVNNATEEKRKRQLESSRDIKTTGVPSASGVPNDFSAAFKARSNQPG